MMRRSLFAVVALLFCGIAFFRLLRPYPISRGVSRSSSNSQSPAPSPEPYADRAYLGFDRNLYPGDDAILILRKSFSFTGYWLSPPPGEKENTWRGKRELLHSNGFGFLVLYRSRESRELKNERDAIRKGTLDAKTAAAAAQREGFASGTIIFLDIEEGGRLPALYHAYLHAWKNKLAQANYKTGVYCSGIPVREDSRVTITTADDIHSDSGSGDVVLWTYNDVCPPSPGCTFPDHPLLPSASGVTFATVWQFAQSPRRKEFTAHCPANYHPDGNCYAPGDTAHRWFLDINSASTADPSSGRE